MPLHPWQSAAAFAARAHEGQERRDGTPYSSHPTRVTLTLVLVFGCTDETVLTAALLHDVIEDTTIDYDDLLEAYGAEVADLVACLSKDTRMAEPDREEAYDAQLAAGSWRARMIKLADVYDNLHDSSGRQRQRVLTIARRALALVADDVELREPHRIVRELVESMERDG